MSRRWLLALVALLASLSLAEVALHVLDLPSRRSDFQFVRPDLEVGEVFADLGAALVPDTELFWALDPSLGARLANQHGLRGWWPSRDKDRRDIRIVCVGDSCTFGTSVRYEDTYGVRLESKLQERWPGRCVETVLLAVPGYSTHQNRLLCERHLAALEPDITVLYCGAWNDYLPAVSLSDSDRHAENTTSAPRLLRLLSRATGPSAVPAEELKQAFREGRAPRGRRVPLDEFRANMETMIELALASGSRVVVVLPPLPADTEQKYPVSLDYRGVLTEVAAKHELPLVDAPWRFALEGGGGAPLFHDWVHPTARGHELIASRVEALVEGDLASTPSGPAAPRPVIESVAPSRKPGFDTPTGKFEILSTVLDDYGYEPLPKYVEPVEGPVSRPDLAADYPLVFNSGARPHTDFRSQHHGVEGLVCDHPEPTVEINTGDASKRGIETGDLVEVRTPRGEVPFRARVTGEIARGAVECSMGGGTAVGPEAWREWNVNELTDLDNHDDISGFPVYKALLCDIRKTESATEATRRTAGANAASCDPTPLTIGEPRRPPRRRIYLDNNATTEIAEAVRGTMEPFLETKHGNPSAIHGAGRDAREGIETARRQVAGLINARPRGDHLHRWRERGRQPRSQGHRFCPTRPRQPHHHYLDRASRDPQDRSVSRRARLPHDLPRRR